MKNNDMQVSSLDMRSMLRGGLAMLLTVTALTLVPVTATTVFNNTALAQDDEDEPRPPPSTRQANTLGRQVYSRIEEVVELRDAEQYAEALEVLGEVREMYNEDDLNNYETYMMWVFYASIAMDQENYSEAIDHWQEAIAVPELGPEQLAQGLQTLGQLYFTQERYEEAITAFMDYLEVAETPSNDIYLRIGMAQYVLEQYEVAIPNVLRNMELERADGQEIPESTYSLLRSLYFNVDDYESARQVLREMIVLFDNPDEWTQLASVHSQLENFDRQAYTYYIAEIKGYLDSETQMMTLGYLLYNNDNPWGAAPIIEQGMEDGIIEENSENLDFLSLSYQIAREDDRAIPPLVRAAEMSNDGELWYRLARLYLNVQNYEDAVDAMDNALETGDVDREDQLYLTQANAYMQLNRYDDAMEAARAAGADERSADRAESMVTYLEREKERYESLQRRREELAEYF